MNNYEDDLDLTDPRFSPAALREIAAKVKEAIHQQKTGPLPAWIVVPPKNQPKGASDGRRRK